MRFFTQYVHSRKVLTVHTPPPPFVYTLSRAGVRLVYPAAIGVGGAVLEKLPLFCGIGASDFEALLTTWRCQSVSRRL